MAAQPHGCDNGEACTCSVAYTAEVPPSVITTDALGVPRAWRH